MQKRQEIKVTNKEKLLKNYNLLLQMTLLTANDVLTTQTLLSKPQYLLCSADLLKVEKKSQCAN